MNISRLLRFVACVSAAHLLFIASPSGGAALAAQDQPHLFGTPGQQILIAVPPSALASGLINTPEYREYVQRLVNASGPHDGDIIVWLVDESGHRLLPDLRAHVLGRTTTSDLQFTFNSPQQPWTASELATMNSWLADVIPLIDTVYGPPAFAITVNVRKDTTLQVAGQYSPWDNELAIKDLQSDVFVHEIIHAYHDDAILTFPSYEEGMTRSAEIAVFDASTYSHWDKFHAYDYDRQYDLLNQPPVASTQGYVFAGVNRTLERYQLASYVWGKLYLERSHFFQNFNQQYDAQFMASPSVSSSESALLGIVASASPSAEGLSFSTWWPRQYALNLAPSAGLNVLQRYADMAGITLVDVYVRDAVGNESPPADGTVTWEARGFDGSLFDHGSVPLSAGLAWIYPVLPSGYHARLQVLTTFTGTAGTASTQTLRPIDLSSAAPKVAGVCTSVDTGTVMLTPMDTLMAPIPVPVVKGQFDAPALLTVKGRIRLDLRSAGFRGTRYITKDRSGYMVTLSPTNFVGVAGGEDRSPVLEAWPSVTRVRTFIQFGAPLRSPARLSVFDVTGRAVRSIEVSAGRTEIEWDGTGSRGEPVAAGVYLIRLSARPGAVARVSIVR